MSRITYKCKKCTWQASIPEQWADLKPKMCGNKGCRVSYLKEPSKLETVLPVKEVKPVLDKSKKKKEEDNG